MRQNPSRPRLRVLIVDDCPDTTSSLTRLLQLWGYETRAAADGPAALALAAEFQPGVVLLDVGLPGMDGYEVARQLRRLPDLGRPVVMSLTGYVGEEERRKALAAGCDRHLVKPVELETLRSLLTSCEATGRPGMP
jgi:two-component system CheB/CheR fusion protein